MRFRIIALTEKGTASIRKIIENEKNKVFQRVKIDKEEPLTIIWTFPLFKKVDARRISRVQKDSFTNIIIEMFLEDGSTAEIDFKVLVE